MAESICAEVLRHYLSHVERMTSIVPEDDHCRLFTPLLLPDNTQLSVCLERDKDGLIVVTDYGDTEGDLFISGLTLDQNDSRLTRIGNRFGVSVEDGVIEKRVPIDQVAGAIDDVILAILDTAYLINTHRPRKMQTFSTEIQQFFTDRGFIYKKDVEARGKSGNQPFDFSLHRGRTTFLADWISATRRSEAKEDSQILAFKAMDVTAETPDIYRFMCLIDDRTREARRAVDSSVTAPLDTYNISYIRWSERESAEELAA